MNVLFLLDISEAKKCQTYSCTNFALLFIHQLAIRKRFIHQFIINKAAIFTTTVIIGTTIVDPPLSASKLTLQLSSPHRQTLPVIYRKET